MRPLHTLRLLTIQGLSILLLGSSLYAQEAKNRARISVDYSKVMPAASSLIITAKYKAEEGFMPAQELTFEVFNAVFPDSLVAVGKTTTDQDGIARYKLTNLMSIKADSAGTYHFLVSSLDNPHFDHVEKEVSVKEALLTAQLLTDQELPILRATLTDKLGGEALEGLPLKVQVQRLFRPMRIGDEFNITDETGTIDVPIDPGIPGQNGTLSLEVVLSDDEQYGNVKAIIEAPVGTVIEDQSSFDDRTMWGPPDKTPLFLLTIPNLLILGVWGTIVLLIMNLIRIYKSKN